MISSESVFAKGGVDIWRGKARQMGGGGSGAYVFYSQGMEGIEGGQSGFNWLREMVLIRTSGGGWEGDRNYSVCVCIRRLLFKVIIGR